MHNPVSSMSSKGQVTIPQEIRARLGLRTGDKVQFVVENGKTIIKPLHGSESPFTKWIGAFPAFKTREEINAWTRELRDDDDRHEDLPK